MEIPFLAKSRFRKQSYHLIGSELKRVEACIAEQPAVFGETVEEYMDYLCRTRGKMLRPALSLLVAGALGEITNEHIRLGATMELIHMASLVHDDVIDCAEQRRDYTTPNALWGNTRAVLLGDMLFSHAIVLGTELGNIRFCRKIGVCVRDICQGEVLQSSRLFDLSITRDDYFDMIGKKTAALFEASTWAAAWISSHDDSLCDELARMGYFLGMAYQIYDDCLDLVGNEREAGKTLSTDAASGKITLPILNLLACGNEEIVDEVREKIEDRCDPNYRQYARTPEFVMAVTDAIKLAKNYVTDARDVLLRLPATPYREALAELTFYFDELLDKCQVD